MDLEQVVIINQEHNKKFNLGFIGDSFTEGVALKYGKYLCWYN